MTEWPEGSEGGLRSSIGWTVEAGDDVPTLERYVIRERVGAGAQGTVFRAFDTHLEREVALKVLHGRRPAAAQRRVAGLHHPNIVALHDAGTLTDGRSFTTMELYEGATLEDRIAAEPGLHLLTHVVQAGQAMAQAHEQGVVHQDLKPSNILVGRFEETQVADWGLAAEVGASRTHFVGTRLYASPRQLAMATVEARDDVWALACILVEALTGTHPFAGSTIEDLGRNQRAFVPPQTLPSELQSVVRACYAGLYPDAAALTGDLVAFQRGERLARHAYTAFEVVRRFVARHQEGVLVVLITGLVLLGGALEGARRVWEANQRAEVERGKAIFAGLLGWPAHPPTPALLERLELAAELWPGPETRGLLVGHAEALRLPGPQRVAHGLRGCDRRVFEEGQPLCIDDDAGRAWFADGRVLEGHGIFQRHAGSDRGHFFRAWTPDQPARREGTPIVHRDEVVWLSNRFDVTTSWGTWEPCGDDLLRHTLALAGASMFAACRDGTLVRRGGDGGELRWTSRSPSMIFSVHAVDEDRVVVGREDGTVELVDLKSGSLQWSVTLAVGQVVDLQHDEARVLVRGVRGTVVVDRSTGGQLRWLPSEGTDDLRLDGGEVVRLTPDALERWSVPPRGAALKLPSGVTSIARGPRGTLAIGTATEVVVHDGGQLIYLERDLPNVVKDVYWGERGELLTLAPAPTEGAVFDSETWARTGREGAGLGREGAVVGSLEYRFTFNNTLSWIGDGQRGSLERSILDLEDADPAWAVGIGGEIWRLTRNGPEHAFQAVGAVGVAAGADRLLLRTRAGGRLVSRSGEVLCEWPGEEALSGAVGDGLVALGYMDGAVRVRDFRCELVFTARLHDARVSDLLFDGDWLWSASWDRTVRRWSVAGLLE